MSHNRIPHSVQSAFKRMHISLEPLSVAKSLERTNITQFTLQEFCPIDQSLEWELSELAWKNFGVLPFAENEVPFIVTNSGRLSEHAATLLFESCRANPPDQVFWVAELGSGTGLFGRMLLDAFRNICAQENTDYYQKLIFLATDNSTESIRHWQERSVFAEHEDRVRLLQCDANNVSTLTEHTKGPIRAVFCNYVLDVLPSTVIQLRNNQVEELMVRTHLVTDCSLLAQHTSLQPEEIRILSNHPEPDERRKLISLLSLFELEKDFQPLRPEGLPFIDQVSAQSDITNQTVLNFGALVCIESCQKMLDQEGFILINDYGPIDAGEKQFYSASQRFGPTLAFGINFPLLKILFDQQPWTVYVPDNDTEAPLHARLITRQHSSELIKTFLNRFGLEGYNYFQRPLDEAREHAIAGRKNEALEAYKLGLSRNRNDWYVLSEIAEYVGLQLRDAQAGMELAQESVRLNPWYSPWLWNVLGDCLFCQNRFADAHEAYMQAQRIDPNDIRTNFNLAFTHAEFREYEPALCSIARALTHDRAGAYREQLLEKQRQILGALSARALGEHERFARRSLSQR